MARSESLQDVLVILAALIGVVDQERDGCAGGFALIHTAQDVNLVRLLALGDMAAGAGPTTIQILLNVSLAQCHAWGATIDDTADGRAVGFTKVGDGEKCSKRVAAHSGIIHQREGDAISFA